MLGPPAGGLAALRRAAGLTQEELAERAGLSARAISSIECGRVDLPHRRSLLAIAAALNLDDEQRERLVRAYRRVRPDKVEPAWQARSHLAADAVSAPPSEGHDRDGTATPPGVSPRQLPPRPASMHGRVAELAAIDTCLAAGRLAGPVVISGLGGIGKTALAVEACAERVRDYPDGCLYAGLAQPDGSGRDPAAVLGEFLFAVGVEASSVPDGLAARSALWRSVASQRRLLVVLDDPVDEAQVRPLLTSDPSAVVLASRGPLGGLDAALRVRLRPVDDDSAAAILAAGAAGRTTPHSLEMQAMVRACAGIPLALRLLAARLSVFPDVSVATIAGRLADEDGRLGELRLGDRSVTRSVESSVRLLSPGARRMLTDLARLDVRDFGTWLFAALADTVGPVADGIADELLGLGLLEPATAAEGMARYRLHDLVRAAVRSTGGPADAGTLRRVLAWATHLAVGVPGSQLGQPLPHVLWPPRPGPLTDPVRDRLLGSGPRWFAGEWRTLVRLVELAAAAGPDHPAGGLLAALRMPMTRADLLQPLLTVSLRCAADPDAEALARACARLSVATVEAELGRYAVAADILHDVLPALADADVCTRAGAAAELGWVSQRTGDVVAAEAAYTEALRLHASIGNVYGQCGASLGFATLLAGTEATVDAALTHARRAIELAEQVGDYRAMTKVAITLARRPAFDRLGAVLSNQLPVLLAVAQEHGDLSVSAGCLSTMAVVALRTGRPADAVSAADHAVQLLEDAGSAVDLAYALTQRGHGFAGLDDPRAVSDYRAALAIRSALGHRGDVAMLEAALSTVADPPAAS